MSLLMHSNKRDTMGFPISVLCSIVTIAIECAVFDLRDRQTDVWTYLTVLPLYGQVRQLAVQAVKQ